MNRKQFLVLVVALLVLGGAGLALFWQDISEYRASGAKIGAKLLPNLKVADVAQLELRDATPLPIRPMPTTILVRLRRSIENTPGAEQHADEHDQSETHAVRSAGPAAWVREARLPSTMITTPITSR